jgi:magnesium chelatase subunit H
MPKPISAGKASVSMPPIRVAIVTMDTHLATATAKANVRLCKQFPHLHLSMHAASEWNNDPRYLASCISDLEQADIIVVTMLFMEEHFLPILPTLEARREHCDAMVCAMSASEVVRFTRLGKFDMSKPASGLSALLKRLRGNKDKTSTGGAAQMKMLRRVPKMLRFIPGTAQDVRSYFLSLQYWLGGSEENMLNMVRFLVNKYAAGPREVLRGKDDPPMPIEYPDLGVYHPRMKSRMAEDASMLPVVVSNANAKGRVGLLLLRSYLLSGNSGHYDGVIAALESRGLQVVPAFAAGLDARPAVEKFFIEHGQPTVDAVVSLSGFSLVGGPAYNDAKAAEATLSALDVPYIAAHPVEFQSLDQWGDSERGLLPVESTIMVAIPELDGATSPMVFGGRAGNPGTTCQGCHKHCEFTQTHNAQDMHTCSERAHMLASRVGRMIELRRAERAQRKIAVVIFNFPPNAGNTGTAAYLSVFESLFHVLQAMKERGYHVELPDSVDALRDSVIIGNKDQYGTDANVHTLITADDHVRRETWLAEIEAQWGPAPGQHLSNGNSIFVLGRQFGNVLVNIQPGMGYEGDPMRLLFERGFAPTHAFSANYRYLREDFNANAVLHFGTHGALEFMPGKQSGMSGACWPDRLIADLPNFYLYASNNPSEGAIAKRRAGATLISYLTPPVSQAGLYRGLMDLKSSIDRWRQLDPDATDRAETAQLVQSQAAELDLANAEPLWSIASCAGEQSEAESAIHRLYDAVLELEYTLIPHGLHVVGVPPNEEERMDMLTSIADASAGVGMPRDAVRAIVDGESTEQILRKIQQGATMRPRDDAQSEIAAEEGLVTLVESLAKSNTLLSQDTEIEGVMQALDGRFIRPAPGGDVLRTPDVLPTGRNLHGFDPFKIPSAFAVRDGAKQAQKLLDRYIADGNALPESIAMVLWGTDNLKTEGSPIAQALFLMGAEPRFDSYGRIAGAKLLPLSSLGRPRIDVVITLSGIFRDLMPLQIKLLAEAAFMAAESDEPSDQNFIRKHALAYMAEHQCTMEEASLRVYGNAEGAYGSNVNSLVENSRWDQEDELAETYSRRKGFAYGRSGRPIQQPKLLQSVLKDVQLTYQNLDSVELGVTTVDNYFDTLGGITGAVKRAKGGKTPPVYIGDQTKGEGTVRTLTEQVALETRTRMLNPKWYEGMLKHGYEGVRQIEVHITNTMGWSATTGQVQPWVYQQLTQTFMLDPEMRDRLAKLNPAASAKVANRLLEASERQFWNPDAKTLAALRQAGEELEDRLEGVYEGAPT